MDRERYAWMTNEEKQKKLKKHRENYQQKKIKTKIQPSCEIKHKGGRNIQTWSQHKRKKCAQERQKNAKMQRIFYFMFWYFEFSYLLYVFYSYA